MIQRRFNMVQFFLLLCVCMPTISRTAEVSLSAIAKVAAACFATPNESQRIIAQALLMHKIDNGTYDHEINRCALCSGQKTFVAAQTKEKCMFMMEYKDTDITWKDAYAVGRGYIYDPDGFLIPRSKKI